MTGIPQQLSGVQERILDAVAKEQEQIARILAALALKVEKSAAWLPEKAPDGVCFSQIVDNVKGLESVIAQELKATAYKEKAIKEILKQVCGSVRPPGKICCPCPCDSFQICKIVGRCVRKTPF